MIAARYSAECFAEHATREEIEAEIAYSKNLWSMKHPNPFPHSAHYSYAREMRLKEILDEIPTLLQKSSLEQRGRLLG